jgi:hypothetical protein
MALLLEIEVVRGAPVNLQRKKGRLLTRSLARKEPQLGGSLNIDA